ncbi:MULTISPECIES: hypothetical protein [Streptomyces]|uniref:DUF3040 domain-containing protein n=1 Tax=Streptomyces spororaveus TaxID=284039 RepID=A0ABQ3TKB4_9ACTN|nr:MULTISPECIES: hypothetical protein [Streptomyces]MCM9078842.1 hypothetical protein [Streptomyces spororaveus]MCX5306741.1 hypothetical protein [Streptomyces sp. NBC_00160]GHI80836.1 hypothetical protein Sspor_63970 [Streptomyces spororaveus]
MSSMPDEYGPQHTNAPAVLGHTLDDLIAAAEHELLCRNGEVARQKTEIRRLKRRRRRARRRVLRRQLARTARPVLGIALGVCGLIAFVAGFIAFLMGSDRTDDWFTIGVTAWGAAAVFRFERRS